MAPPPVKIAGEGGTAQELSREHRLQIWSKVLKDSANKGQLLEAHVDPNDLGLAVSYYHQ